MLAGERKNGERGLAEREMEREKGEREARGRNRESGLGFAAVPGYMGFN